MGYPYFRKHPYHLILSWTGAIAGQISLQNVTVAKFEVASFHVSQHSRHVWRVWNDASPVSGPLKHCPGEMPEDLCGKSPVPKVTTEKPRDQQLLLVPWIGGRWYRNTQLAVYTTYIPLVYCQLGCYMLPITYQGNQETPLKGFGDPTVWLRRINGSNILRCFWVVECTRECQLWVVHCIFCCWKKFQTTTWDVKKTLKVIGCITNLNCLAKFQPSTVWKMVVFGPRGFRQEVPQQEIPGISILTHKQQHVQDTVDGSEIRLTSWYDIYPYIYPLFTGLCYIPGDDRRISEASTVLRPIVKCNI